MLLVAATDGSPLPLVSAGKPLLILSYLATHPEGAPRDALAVLGWGNREESSARASLRQALYRLRQLLGQDALIADDVTVRLTVEIPSDWRRASEAIAAGDDLALLAAVGGRFLEGLDDSDGEDAGGWLVAERARWDALTRDAATRQGRLTLQAGDFEGAVILAQRALAARPDRIVTWELYLDALAATETWMRVENGLAELEAAGQHGPLGIAEPGAWQLLARRVRRTADRNAPQVTTSPATRPVALPFVGREGQLAYLRRHLALGAGEERRIITVVAGPGFGKSRLLRELRTRHGGDLGQVVQVDALPGEGGTSWAFLNRIAEALCDLPAALGMEPSKAATLVAMNPSLGTRFPGIAQHGIGPIRDTAIVARAFAELLDAVTEGESLCLLLDDCQWADPLSLSVIRDAFGTGKGGGAVALMATRDDAALPPTDQQMLYLPSLMRDDVSVMLTSYFPTLSHAVLADASEMLFLMTGGVPIYLARAMHRLSTSIAPHDAEQQLMLTVPTLALHRDPHFPTALADRRLLGYLAIAGDDIGFEELAKVSGDATPDELTTRLNVLLAQSWLSLSEHGARLSHDFVRLQVTEVLDAAEWRALAMQRAHALASHGTALHDLQHAVRLSLEHGGIGEASSAVRTWCRRVRGGPRGRALSALVLPHDAPRTARWRIAAAATPSILRVVLLGIALASAATWGVIWWVAQPATLRLENVPRVPGIDAENMGHVRRNIAPPVFTVRDGFGRISRALDGRRLEILGWSSAVDSARLEQPAPIRDGTVTAGGLLVYGGLRDSLGVTFRVSGVPGLPVTVFRGFDSQSLAIVGGVINGQVLSGRSPEIIVGPGDSLSGFVQLRYTTPSQAAIWMLAGSSTMRPAIEDTLSVITLHAGVVDAVTEPFVARRVPTTPGSYWLIWAFAPENDAVSILSLTNWRCAAPHWNDGNDLATAADSALAGAWGGGWLWLMRDMCEEGEAPRRARTLYPAATIKVVVREE